MEDFETMFGMFDVTRTGSITMKQAREALRTILHKEADFPDSLDGPDTQRIDMKTFVDKMAGAIGSVLPRVLEH